MHALARSALALQMRIRPKTQPIEHMPERCARFHCYTFEHQKTEHLWRFSSFRLTVAIGRMLLLLFFFA